MQDQKQKTQIALKLKEEGNEFFKKKQYEQAIQKYTQAITYNPTISILFSNRSRCYRNLQQYEKSYQDAQTAVKFDDKNIKAYYLMGQSLVALSDHTKDKEKINMAIQKLKKSLTLCPSQGKSQFQQNFVHQIYKAKKKLWKITSQEEAQRKKALRSYLINIIQTDKELSQQKKDTFQEKIQKLLNSKIQIQKGKILEALVCPLTKKLMINPVCNQYGNSYSKKEYLKHLSENGKLDPLSGKPIQTPILYNNINLKKAIQNFLEKNPWAYDEIV